MDVRHNDGVGVAYLNGLSRSWFVGEEVGPRVVVNDRR